MAKDRARRRAEREAVEAAARRQRARRNRWVQRRRRVGDRVRGWLPRRPRTAPGLLAARRRRRMAMLLGVIVIICAISWPLLPDWGGRIMVLAAALMLAPVAWVLSFGRV